MTLCITDPRIPSIPCPKNAATPKWWRIKGHLFLSGKASVKFLVQQTSLTITMVYPATFALALFFTQAARALPQALWNGASDSPTSSLPASSPMNSMSSSASPGWSSTPATYYSSTPNPFSSSYYTPTPNPYSLSSYYTTTNNYLSTSYTSYHSSTPSPYSSLYYTTTNNYPPSSYTSYYSSTPSPSYPSSKPKPNTPSSPTPLRATYDITYDNKSGSMNGVACSNGANGLAARFPTFGDVPSFPFIGGAFDVVWNSPNCGSCWSLTNPSTGVTINMTAIDAAGAGFNIAKEAFETLTGGQSGQGVVDVVANKVSPSVCG
jgi:Cerato-platanin